MRPTRIRAIANVPIRRKVAGAVLKPPAKDTSSSIDKSGPASDQLNACAASTEAKNSIETIVPSEPQNEPAEKKAIKLNDDETSNIVNETPNPPNDVHITEKIISNSGDNEINTETTDPSTADTSLNDPKPSLENGEKNVLPEVKPKERRIGRIKAFAKIPARRKVVPTAQQETEPTEKTLPLNTENTVEQVIQLVPKEKEPQPEIAKPPVPNAVVENIDTVISPKPPPSPCKLLNRPRIRSAPRLGIRRNSTSASESEDDSRRSYISRIRNDSISSSISTSRDSSLLNRENVCPSPTHKLQSGPVKKKVRRSECARKIADAKRDFFTKFGTKTPDRQKLTMMDLIYYNPVGNPMPVRKTKPEERVEEIANQVATVEEEADEPEEEARPVPQVKVGENGEIILDEQSLVIETSDMKKGRELTTTAINYDDLDTGYGIYKRTKRTKDWSPAETKQFYRVLQMIGTDFSVMETYFKDRNRRDIKIKFKKEEKINRALIDKVLKNPRPFDIDELTRLLEEDELAAKKAELEKIQAMEKKKENTKRKGVKRERQKTGSWFARQIYSNKKEMLRDIDSPKIVQETPKSPPKVVNVNTGSESDSNDVKQPAKRVCSKKAPGEDSSERQMKKKNPAKSVRIQPTSVAVSDDEMDAEEPTLFELKITNTHHSCSVLLSTCNNTTHIVSEARISDSESMLTNINYSLDIPNQTTAHSEDSSHFVRENERVANADKGETVLGLTSDLTCPVVGSDEQLVNILEGTEKAEIDKEVTSRVQVSKGELILGLESDLILPVFESDEQLVEVLEGSGEETNINDGDKDVERVESPESIEPGSLVIRFVESPVSGRPIRQAFAVGETETPVDLTDEQFALLESYLGNNDSITMDLPVVDSVN